MKIVRFIFKDKIMWGVLENSIIKTIQGDIFNEYLVLEETIALSQVKLLAPCTPSKAVCIGLNYSDHAKELNLSLPKEPVIFIKPSTSLNHPGEGVKYPKMTQNLHYEAELAIVIKKQTSNIKKQQVKDHILGYSCANDVTARDLQNKDGQWTRCKSFDGFMPLGPCIETDLDANNSSIKLYLNDELRQCSSTSNFIFNIEEIVSFVSQVMTLLPGDVILTGTPSGIGEMNIGDKVIVDIEGIGRLENNIIDIDF